MNRKVNIVLSLSLVVMVAAIYLISRSYASFETNLNSTGVGNIAMWNILVNDKNITTTEDAVIDITNIIWDEGVTKIAPGSTGTATLVINADGTDVAVKYTISLIDHVVDSNYLLTVIDISDSDGNLVKTGVNSYTGVITIDEIMAKKTETVTIKIGWVNDESNNSTDSLIGLGESVPTFIDLSMNAIQYTGEAITPYTGVTP